MQFGGGTGICALDGQAAVTLIEGELAGMEIPAGR